METLRFHTARLPGRPDLDTAVSRALMLRVAGRRAPASFRLYRPDPMLAFSVFDRTRPGFAAAVAAARDAGFAPIVRLAGGKAAVFHEHTLAFAWSRPIADLRAGVEARFEEMASILARALRGLGIDARVGEVAGEYCPGRHSVNAGGRTKLAGIGQRVVRGAAHVGGVVVVGGSARARAVLEPVYAALGFDFDPATVGSVEDELGAVAPEAVADALRAELARTARLEDAELDADTLALAAELAPEHRADEPDDPERWLPLEGAAKGVLERSL